MDSTSRTLNKMTSSIYPLISTLTSNTTQPYMVGGCVRDAIIGVESKDIDIEVHGVSSMDELKRMLIEDGLFREDEVDEVGKSFGVLKVRCRGQVVDVSLPRSEKKTGKSHGSFKITVDPTLTLEQAASRRDITINSIMYNTRTGVFVDPFGGIEDIENRVIRHTSEAFSEDPLRVLRVVQFAARFGFSVAYETIQLCRELVDEFQYLSIERVWGEFEKIAEKGRFIDYAMEILRETEWSRHFPAIHGYTGIMAQRTADLYRQAGDENYSWAVVVCMALQSHDPIQFCESIGAPQTVVKAVQKMAPINKDKYLFSEYNPTAARVLARKLAPYSIYDFAKIIQHAGIAEEAFLAGVLDKPEAPWITGHDLIERGIKQDRHFGEIMKGFIDAQDRRQFYNKRQALAQLDKYAESN